MSGRYECGRMESFLQKSAWSLFQRDAGTYSVENRFVELKLLPIRKWLDFVRLGFLDFRFHSWRQCAEKPFAVALVNYAGVADDYAAAFCR